MARLWLFIALPALRVWPILLIRRQPVHPMPAQNAVHRRARDGEPVPMLQVVGDSAGPEVIVLPGGTRFCLPPRRGVARGERGRGPRAVGQAGRPVFVIPPLPFVEGLSGHAEVPARSCHISRARRCSLQDLEPPAADSRLFCLGHRVSTLRFLGLERRAGRVTSVLGFHTTGGLNLQKSASFARFVRTRRSRVVSIDCPVVALNCPGVPLEVGTNSGTVGRLIHPTSLCAIRRAGHPAASTIDVFRPAGKRCCDGPARAHHDGDGARQGTAKGEFCERVLCPRHIEGGQCSGKHRARRRAGHQRDHCTHAAPHQPADPGAECQQIRARRQPRDDKREVGLPTIQPVLSIDDLLLEDRNRRSAATEHRTAEPSKDPRNRSDGRSTRASGVVGLERRGCNRHGDRSWSRLAARVNSLVHGAPASRSWSAEPTPFPTRPGSPAILIAR